MFKNAEDAILSIDNIDDVVLLIQNTNISTFFQFIDTLANFYHDKTSLYVLYQVGNLQKAALIEELHALLDMGKIGLECFEENKKEYIPSHIPSECISEYYIPSRKQLFLISGSADFYGKIKRHE